jgi:hypothetical protein
MRSLWFARYALLASAAIYAAAMALGLLKIGNGELMFGLSILSAVGIGVSAILCVVLQFVILPMLLRPKP